MKRRHLRWALPLLAGAMALFPSTTVRGQQLPRPPQGLVAQSPSTSSTRTMREEADRQFRSGSFNRAIQIWSLLIARGQDLQDSLYNRAQAYLVLRQFPLALADLNQLQKLQQPAVRSNTLVLRGIVHNETGNYQQALADFDQALAIDRNPLVFSNRAIAYQRTGQLAKAEADLQAAVKANSSQSNVYNLGAIQRLLNRYDLCIENAGKVIAANVTFAPAYTLRGMCLYSLGRYESAIAELLRGTTINRFQPDAYHYLGLSMMALKKSDQANQALLKAADLYLSQGDQQKYQEIMRLLASPGR